MSTDQTFRTSTNVISTLSQLGQRTTVPGART